MEPVDSLFLDMARGFGARLPAQQQVFWNQILENYANGHINKELVVQNMNFLGQQQQASAASAAAPSAPVSGAGGTPFLAAAQATPSSCAGEQCSSGASFLTACAGANPWANPPPSVFQNPAEEMWNNYYYHGYDHFQYAWPPPSHGFPPKGVAKGFVPQKGKKGAHGGKAFPEKGRGKGGGGCFGGKGKGNRSGGLGRRGRPEGMTAQNLADAENRMQIFMDQHPDFVFRPRDSVPAAAEEVYNHLGEKGPQLWKNLRHHLQGEEGVELTTRVVQFMAMHSTWSLDQTSMREKARKERRERDAESSRLSGATGFTGRSRGTIA